jgi:myosin heavy subunit
MNTILESDVTMATSISFSAILDEIQKSNLNFKIELSPFSAVVTLKKTPIKDRKGLFAVPSPPSSFLLHQAQNEIAKLSQRINILENENYQLKWDKKRAVEQSKKLNIAVDDLKHELEVKSAKIKVEEDFLVETSKIQIENEALKSQISKLECMTTSFNKKLAETMCKNDDEKAASEKSVRQEIKQWKKELGTERKLRINLEKKVSNLKLTSFASSNLSPASPYLPSMVSTNDSPSPVINCNICAEPISDYTPRFFLSNEINPACSICYEHSNDDYDSEAKSQAIANSSFAHQIIEYPLPDPIISTCTPTPTFPFPLDSSAGFPPTSRTTTPCTVPDFPPQRKPPL